MRNLARLAFLGGLALFVGGLWGTVAPGVAQAAPVVDIRERTQLIVDRVKRTPTGAWIGGRLLEASTQRGVPGAQVVLQVAGQRAVAVTRDDGAFELELALRWGSHTLAAAFSGDALYAATDLGASSFVLGKEPLGLRLTADDPIELGATAIEIAVLAESLGAPAQVAVTLALRDGTAETTLDTLRTDADGQGTFVLTSAQVGGAGEKRLRAHARGDDVYNPADAEFTLRIVTSTRLDDVTATTGSVAFEDTIEATGRLLDARNTPLAGARVNLLVDGVGTVSTLTGDDGRFSLDVRADEFAPGPHTVAVEFGGQSGGLRGSRTPPEPFSVRAPSPVPLGYTVGAFATTAVLLAGFLLLRARPRASTSSPVPSIFTETSPTSAAPSLAKGGVSLAPQRLSALLTRRASDGIGGVIVSALHQQPLPAAQVVIDVDGPTTTTGADGRFAMSALPNGRHAILFTAPGHVTESAVFDIPHTGAWDDARIVLVPVRERVFQLYLAVVEHALPRRALGSIWSPREVFEHLRSRTSEGPLRDVTTRVEQLYFGPDTPQEEVIPALVALCDAARRASGAASDSGG